MPDVSNGSPNTNYPVCYGSVFRPGVDQKPAEPLRIVDGMLFSTRKVSDLFDPSLRQKRKSLEKHHLFPKHYLREEFGLDKRQINQVGNFTYLEYPDNVDIGDDPPQVYFEKIRQSEQFRDKPEVLAEMMRDHCLPKDFFAMKYDDFLQARRRLMAKTIRSTFESL